MSIGSVHGTDLNLAMNSVIMHTTYRQKFKKNIHTYIYISYKIYKGVIIKFGGKIYEKCTHNTRGYQVIPCTCSNPYLKIDSVLLHYLWIVNGSLELVAGVQVSILDILTHVNNLHNNACEQNWLKKKVWKKFLLYV